MNTMERRLSMRYTEAQIKQLEINSNDRCVLLQQIISRMGIIPVKVQHLELLRLFQYVPLNKGGRIS